VHWEIVNENGRETVWQVENKMPVLSDSPHWYNSEQLLKGYQMSKDKVENGVVVSMEYTLHVDGELLDSSEGHGPLQYLAGHRNIVAGLEDAMMGMGIGDSKDVVVAPADGYGEFEEDAFLDVPKDQFPKDMALEEDMELTVRDESGEGRYARIETIEGETVRLNFNHPLAGEELHFNVKVVSLREPTAEELDHGHVHEGHHHH